MTDWTPEAISRALSAYMKKGEPIPKHIREAQSKLAKAKRG